MLALASSSSVRADTLQIAAQNDEHLQGWEFNSTNKTSSQHANAAHWKTPLGSVWKLFVFSYLEANHTAESPYRCQGKDREEVYCCNPGETVERNSALVQSCGLYFEPARWQITAAQWNTFWKNAAPTAIWLQDLNRVKPDTTLAVKTLLSALSTLPEQAKARDTLLDAVIRGRARTILPALATQLRVKTFSWKKNDVRVGGFAGWTQSGTPIWAMAPGTSASLFKHWPEAITQTVEKLNKDSFIAKSANPGCVRVEFFQRYPIQTINQSGQLIGDVKIDFANGTRFNFNASAGELSEYNKKISGRFTINEYVARVIDREGASEPRPAALALAVAARSYLLQTAQHEQACLDIADSSATQRVSPEVASNAARYVANITDGLVLDAPVQYHQNEQKTGQMSWRDAVDMANAGASFETILYRSFPQSQLKNSYTQAAECTRFYEGEAFLTRWSKRWGEKIHSEPGYQSLGKVRVCRVNAGKPYSDRSLNTIFVRGLNNLNDQVTMAHEFCHLAFKYHPNTLNENYIETLARKLVLEQ